MKDAVNRLVITLGASFLLMCMPLCVEAVDLQMNGDVAVSGTLSAGSISGSGAGLTSIPGTAITNTSITVNQLADSAVTVGKLADAAVTSAKIAFFNNVAIVAPSGGDFTNPALAMSNYSAWCGTPSPTNPCLLKIMPGVYNVGTTTVQMQPYIDIEGSGESTTMIQGNVDNVAQGILNGASNMEMRFLTVKNNGGGTYAYAIYNSNAASVKITNVTATASGGTWNYGISSNSSSPILLNVTATASGGSGSYGVVNGGSSATLINVKAIAGNIGVYNSGSSAMMQNVIAKGAGGPGLNICGVNNYGGGSTYSVTITNSVISGDIYAISSQDNFNTRVSNTELTGIMLYNAVPIKCAGVFNSNYTFYANTCP
jgi:hypothetical protein